MGGGALTSRIEQSGLDEIRVLSDLERVEELMSAYGNLYDDLVNLPYSRFEDVWTAYSTRTSIEKLDREVARQRSVIQGAMAEQHQIESAMLDLQERAEEARQMILHPDRLYEEMPKTAQTPWGELRTDKWWEAPAAAEATPVSDESDPADQRLTEADLGLGLEDRGKNKLDLTDFIEWE